MCVLFFFFKQKTAYEMRISDWSSDVCSSDLCQGIAQPHLVDGEEQLPFLHDLPVMNSDRVHPPRNIGGKRNDIGAKLSVARLRRIGIVIVEMPQDQSRERRQGERQHVLEAANKGFSGQG